MRLLSFLISVVVLFALADPGVAQVRYSVNDASPATTATIPPTAKTAGLRLLTWPGKVTLPSASVSRAEPQRPIPSAALPTSIYAAPTPPSPPAQAPVQALAQAGPPAAGAYPSPRYYSLHRPYGQTPDPVPLSPQFFSGGQADLAEPPPPPARRVTTASGQVVRAQSADPATAGDPNN